MTCGLEASRERQKILNLRRVIDVDPGPHCWTSTLASNPMSVNGDPESDVCRELVVIA
jgi:hypothetical protein